jgi:hypothetical protein
MLLSQRGEILSPDTVAARYANSALLPGFEEILHARAEGMHIAVRDDDAGLPQELSHNFWVVGKPDGSEAELEVLAVAALLGGLEGAFCRFGWRGAMGHFPQKYFPSPVFAKNRLERGTM